MVGVPIQDRDNGLKPKTLRRRKMEKSVKTLEKARREGRRPKQYESLQKRERQIINAMSSCRRRHKNDPEGYQLPADYKKSLLAEHEVYEVRASNQNGMVQKEFIIFRRLHREYYRHSKFTWVFAEPGDCFTPAQVQRLKRKAQC